MTSLQQDVLIYRSLVPKHASTSQQIENVKKLTKEKKAKGKKMQSSTPSTNYPLEDYHMDIYVTIRDWIIKNPSR